MKSPFSYIILAVICFALGMLIMNQCKDSDKEELAIIRAERDSIDIKLKLSGESVLKLTYEAQKDSLRIDSLQAELKNIKKISIIKEREIDLAIAEDSANSVLEYKKALNFLTPTPITKYYPTYLELGYGAKFLSGIPGLRLQINNLESQVNNYKSLNEKKDKIISEKDFQITGEKDLRKLEEMSTEYWKQEFERLDSFWYNRFVWTFGGYTIYEPVTGRIYLGIGTGVGIKILGNE